MLIFNNNNGLLPVVAQDKDTGEVLMLAYMNETAWQETLRTKTATYFSRSRQKLWVKGETSGHIQKVEEIRIDCDADAVLLKVSQIGGAACHTGHKSCFHKQVTSNGVQVIGEPVFDPEEVYGK